MGTTTTKQKSDLEQQREYAAGLVRKGFNFTLMLADAFIRGIRDIGYRHTGTALDEQIDNSIQGQATQVHVALRFDGGSDKKPDAMAVIDNGHGMDPDMLRIAVVWGGTHREGDRSGFGRYGYGLPSSAVSQARKYTVYSKTEDGEWNAVTIDLDAIARGEYTDAAGEIVVPEPSLAQLPEWILDYLSQHAEFADFDHGTVVEMETLDRITWKTEASLERNLLPHFGTTYRNYVRATDIWVNHIKVAPVDPLFLTPGHRFYDLDEDRAEAVDTTPLQVKTEDGEIHEVGIRMSYLPPTFQLRDKASLDRSSRNMNERFPIMKDHTGLIVLRNGRQIDVVGRLPDRWPTLQNYDRNWKLEIDVPAALDEEISITTSKQQVRLNDRLWELLDKHGLKAAMRQQYDRVEKAFAALKADRKAAGGQSSSEVAMGETEKFNRRRPMGDPVEREKRAAEALRREIERRARAAGVPEAEVEKAIEAEFKESPYRVLVENLPGAPFYRVEQLGTYKVLYLNQAHRFYPDVYAGPDSTPYLRACLEVLLFSLGEGELAAWGDKETFYQVERAGWSETLSIALGRLKSRDPIEPRPDGDEIDSTEEAQAAA